MRNQLHIALRYLFAKKSHNVINIISIISAAGIAIGSMALILILSVYNGLDNSIKQSYESYKADFVISPAYKKTFTFTLDDFNRLIDFKDIVEFTPILEENIFLKYGENDAIATIRGINEDYLHLDHITGNIIEGSPKTNTGEIEYALIGQNLARKLGLRVRFLTPIELYFPDKKGNISIANPMESLKYRTIYPSAIIKTDGEDIQDLIYAGMTTVRELTGYGNDEYTSIEVYTGDLSKKESAELHKKLKETFPQYNVKNKEEQNATLYRMMKAEKFAVYLILFFVIVIISVNIFSSLSMLITDKREDIETFLSLGATQESVQKIFHLHGFLISLLGCMIGIAMGLLLAVIQQQTGIISIPGNYLISAYPVDIHFTDVAITFIGVSGTGFFISAFPSRKIFQN